MTDIHFESEDGLNLYAKSYGSDSAEKTVLCLHGLTRNHKDFEPMITELSDRHPNMRFVAWDTRGRCQSEPAKDPSTYALPYYANDAIRLMDTIGVNKVTLIGTSMGGLISMVLRSMVPDRIKGVAMNDIGPVIEIKGLQTISGYLGKTEPLPSFEAAADASKVKLGNAHPDFSDEDWLSFAKRTWRARADGQVEPDYDPRIVENFSVPDQLDEDDEVLWGMFKALNGIPFLLIRGALSELLSEKTALRMMDAHSNAKLATVPNTGHAPVLNEPIAVEAISEFLSQQ